MTKYIKCPRCELNYIDPRQDMCDVCKAELGEPLNTFTDEEEDLELCPVCKRNFISFDEDMCQECRLAKEASEDPAEEDEDWREYLDDEDESTEDDGTLPPEDIDDDFEDEFEDEEEEADEEFEDEDDDFEEVKVDDSDDDFDDFDDEDEEDDDNY